MRKSKYSNGDYEFRFDAKTFSHRFYYINFLDTHKCFDSEYSIKFKNRPHAYNTAKWYLKNKWKLSEIPYKVVSIGIYDSINGHIESLKIS